MNEEPKRKQASCRLTNAATFDKRTPSQLALATLRHATGELLHNLNPAARRWKNPYTPTILTTVAANQIRQPRTRVGYPVDFNLCGRSQNPLVNKAPEPDIVNEPQHRKNR